MTETKPQEPALQVGAEVLYWRDKRPLLATHAVPATIVSLTGEGEAVELVLDVKPAGAKEFRARARLSKIATPGAATVTGVTPGGEFDRSDKAKLAPAGKALITHPQPAAPAASSESPTETPAAPPETPPPSPEPTVTTPTRGGRGRSSSSSEPGSAEGT